MSEDTEEYSEEQQFKGTAGMYTPTMDRYGSSIVTLTDPKDSLYNLELFLLSLRENKQTGELVKMGEPLLNREGINTVMSSVESVVHHMNTLSNFTEEDIIYLHDSLKENLVRVFMIKSGTFKLDKRNRDLILGNSLRFAYGFMKRAFKEGDRKFWKGTVSEIKHTQETNKQKSGGFNPFKMWGGKS